MQWNVDGVIRMRKPRGITTTLLFIGITVLLVTGFFAVHRFTGVIRSAADGHISSSAESSSTIAGADHQMRVKYGTLTSTVDADHDGIDDYTDLTQGARLDAKARPTYDAGYYMGGYPPADRGACTDLVWRAFAHAGYDLKTMVDADVAANPKAYAAVAPSPDPNIDFRRTSVLHVFFQRHAQPETTNISDYAAWQQGDIVVFDHDSHIGVISDTRDAKGTSFVLHNMGQQQRENDYLAFSKHKRVIAHYRFDASKVPASVLKSWRG